jgi:hypothetical protein
MFFMLGTTLPALSRGTAKPMVRPKGDKNSRER